MIMGGDEMSKFFAVLCMVFVVAVGGSTAFADGAVPKSGTFDIDGSLPAPLVFNPEPWVSPSLASVAYLWPFASDNLYKGVGYSNYNLAQAKFSNGLIITSDYGEKSGDFGIRIFNSSKSSVTFGATILTLDFTNGSFDVHLPRFTFNGNENMFFWVSTLGATYYATTSMGTGFPDISAATAMAAGDTYLAETPEPATVLLLTLGGIYLRKRR